MEIIEITKRLGRRQRLVIKGITVGCTDFTSIPNIAPVIGSLVTKGLIAANANQVTLTATGVRAVFEQAERLFSGLPDSAADIMTALCEVSAASKDKAAAVPKSAKLKRKELLLLHFLLQSPRSSEELIGVTQILPGLLVKGFVTELDGRFTVTESGSEAFAAKGVQIMEDTEAMFYAADRLKRNAERKAESDALLELWRDGLTFDAIGEMLGITRQAVQLRLSANPGFTDVKAAKKNHRVAAEEEKRKDAKLKRIERSLALKFEDQVEQLWDWEKNGSLNPAGIPAHCTTMEVWWRCPKGHSWKRRPADIAISWTRSKTSGCPQCAGRTRKPEPQAKLTAVYPELVSQYWNFEKNGEAGLIPDELSLGSNRKIWFRCPHDGYEWSAILHSTVRQQWSKGNAGCKVCNGTVNRKRGTWSEAPRLMDKFPLQVATLWIFEKNNAMGLTPEVTCGSSKKAWFKCTKDNHEWVAGIASIKLSWEKGNSGCPVCAGHERPSHQAAPQSIFALATAA